MELQLFQNKSSENTINKDLTLITTKNINLKQSTNLYQTFLVFKNDGKTDYSKINYAKMLNKFYFVSHETIQNNSLIRLELKEDVLYTFKDDILNSDVDIIEKSKPSNYNQNFTTNEIIKDKYLSDKTIKLNDHIIVQTVGNPLREV